jgi:hypothetical protein
LGFHSVSPMKQQSAYRHVTPLGRFRATQSLLFLQYITPARGHLGARPNWVQLVKLAQGRSWLDYESVNKLKGVLRTIRLTERGLDRFVLDQHADMGFCSVSPMKQQSVDRHVAPLGRFRATQSLLFLLNAACLAEKQQIPILKSLV